MCGSSDFDTARWDLRHAFGYAQKNTIASWRPTHARTSSLQPLHIPDLEGRIPARACDLGRPLDPRYPVDAVLVGIERLDAARGLGEAPHIDVGIERAARGVGAGVVPGEAHDARRVGGPAVRGDGPVGALEDKDLALGVAGGEVGAVAGEGEGGDGGGGLLEDGGFREGVVGGEGVDAHVVAGVADGYGGAGGGEGGRRVVGAELADELLVFGVDGDAVGGGHDEAAFGGAEALGLGGEGGGGAGEGVGGLVDGAEGVVPANAVGLPWQGGELRDLVGVCLAVDDGADALLGVPVADAPVEAACPYVLAGAI